MKGHGELNLVDANSYCKHVNLEKVTWENNRKNGALKSGVENASKKRKAGAGRGWHGTGILFEEPNPTGSRPRDLIGLYKKWQSGERPQPAKRSSREEGGATGAPLRLLFERETEHL